jgi:pimeloyl-ACP methyl ester carboxylesterase
LQKSQLSSFIMRNLPLRSGWLPIVLRYENTVILLLIGLQSMAYAHPKLYCIPGQGADERAFALLKIDGFEVVALRYIEPIAGESLRAYATRMAEQIDPSQPFSLLGVSLGGMIAVEITDMLKPINTILISSAKHSDEIRGKYNLVRRMRSYRWVSGSFLIAGTLITQTIVEPVDAACRAFFRSMILRKSPFFMKEAARMVMEWDRTKSPEGIIHIHGSHDHTIPVAHVKADIVVNSGHMFILEQPEFASKLISAVLR